MSAPEGSLLNARPPAAVVGGNVETSSRVADLVFEALAAFAPVGANGQGTMNNLTLAAEDWTYYETIGGGQGACPDADGPSAEHVAMSNTLNTPIEALETEYPVRVTELSIRPWQRRRRQTPWRRWDRPRARSARADALHADRRAAAERAAGPATGARRGAVGRDLLNGEPLPAKGEGELERGDRLRIETPGGGGFGSEPNS